MKNRIVEFPESRQLFTPIPNLKLYDYISQDKLQTLDGNNMPFIEWPDGSPCLQANAYMIKVRNQFGRGGNGPSRLGSKGGTFGDYASKISHLIRYCYYNKLSFTSLSDDDFCNFIDGLRIKTKPNNPQQLKRNERTITNIGRRCLSFLAHVGEMNQIHNFVGVDGTITIDIVDSIAYRNGKAFKRSSVHHRSFRTANAKKTRRPISEATVEKLREAIDEMSTSEFLCNRRHLMISLFQELGARRGEIQPITVTQVLAASKLKKPKILVTTLKRGEIGLTRELRLSSPLIDDLLRHIRDDRRSIMKRFKGVPDHDFLFVTERGGRPLKADTFTTEFSLIRRAAGIEEQACAHLFRHAYCTNVVADLIAETKSLSPDSFRQTLMTNKMLAEHAMFRTGHTTLESLLNYVDAAFRIKSKFEQVIHNVEVANCYERHLKRRKRLLQSLKNGKISKEQYIDREEALTAAMDRDLLPC